MSAITTVLSIATCTARALQVSKTASFLPGRGDSPMSLPGPRRVATARRRCPGEVLRGALQGSPPNQASTRARVRGQGQVSPSLRQPGHPQSPQPSPPNTLS